MTNREIIEEGLRVSVTSALQKMLQIHWVQSSNFPTTLDTIRTGRDYWNSSAAGTPSVPDQPLSCATHSNRAIFLSTTWCL